MQNPHWSVSNMLIAISMIFMGMSFLFPDLLNLGMNTYYLAQENYILFMSQFLSFQFLHGSFLHLLSNALFIMYFGNQVENIMGEKRYLMFFLLSSFFIGSGLLLFASGNTIGMSGFALAVLTYYTLHLRSIKNPEYTGGITAIIINLMIGFAPGISFLGHLFGALFGIIFYLGNTILKKRT